MLLEAQVDRSERAANVSDVVDSEPASQGIAASSVAKPIEATKCRAATRKIGVIARLKLAERIHGLEDSSPDIESADTYCKSASRRTDGEYRSRRSISVCLALADVIAAIALQIHEIPASRR